MIEGCFLGFKVDAGVITRHIGDDVAPIPILPADDGRVGVEVIDLEGLIGTSACWISGVRIDGGFAFGISDVDDEVMEACAFFDDADESRIERNPAFSLLLAVIETVVDIDEDVLKDASRGRGDDRTTPTRA